MLEAQARKEFMKMDSDILYLGSILIPPKAYSNLIPYLPEYLDKPTVVEINIDVPVLTYKQYTEAIQKQTIEQWEKLIEEDYG